MGDEENDELIDSFGLGYETLYSTEGKVCAAKFSEIILALQSSEHNIPTKVKISSQFGTWASIAAADLKRKTLIKVSTEMFDMIAAIATKPDDNDNEADDYNGVQDVASNFASGLSTACAMEQKIAVAVAPLAYNAIDKILDSGRSLKEESGFVKACAATRRTDTCRNLLMLCPWQGKVDIPNAFNILKRIILLPNSPDSLKTQAKSSISTMAMVNKECMKFAGNDLMDIIVKGEHYDLIHNFSTVPEMYTNNPESLHNHLEVLFTEFEYMNICSLFYNISKKSPEVLVPYLSRFVDKLTSDPMMGSLTVMILSEISAVSPETVYPYAYIVVKECKNISNTEFSVAGLVGHCGHANTPEGAADKMFELLVSMLETSTDTNALTTILSQISNIKSLISSVEILQKHLPVISNHRTSFEIIVTEIEDYASGLSLRGVNERVVAVEEKIAQLNQKVAETCFSFEDVIAYVDANIADVKDFLGDVVKKLPTPKRLEVVGTFRKTLLLHFECAHTGLEFPIESHEWSKWLKMGFSLVKASKAVIDVGMGNPLALMSTGINLVSEIYTAYKTNDDDEFNTYITNPFLTSSEQDMLLEKLRAQLFFDKFAYDTQCAGWYLINPKKDGKQPGGEAGSVSKVKQKEGYGVGETMRAMVKDGVDVVTGNPDLLVGAGDVGEVMNNVLAQTEDGEKLAEVGGGIADDMNKREPSSTDIAENSKASKTVSGTRAAAIRSNKVAPDPAITSDSSGTNVASQLQKLEQRVTSLEQENIILKGELRKAQNSGCVIS